jgi:hypothetical protein
MSNNPFRQSREESFTNGFRYGNGYNGSNVDVTGTTGYDVGNSNNVEKSNGSALDASLGSSFDTEHQTHISTTKSDNGNGTIPAQYRDQVLLQDEAHHQNNGSGSQRFSNPFAVQPSNSAQYVTDEQSHPIALEPTIHSTLITSNGHEVDSLQELVQGVHLQHQAPEVVTQPRHAHVPSISQIRKESLANVRPTYVRALSSHIAESMAPSMTHGEAHAEAVRRLGKAEKTVKTIKRRGSNESLASLVSYSIRRPSISVTPKGNGYSLDALAYVLEEAAQEGNLELVQAVMALGANPNFRSVNRIKNRRHDALNKATAAGHVEVIDYLIRQGATYNLGDSAKKDAFEPIDYKLLDVAYSGYGEVARYLIANQGANPFAEQWPREYFDANRTVYRRVAPTRVYQRSVLDAIARMGSQEADTPLVNIIMRDPRFNPTAVASRVYIDQHVASNMPLFRFIHFHQSRLGRHRRSYARHQSGPIGLSTIRYDHKRRRPDTEYIYPPQRLARKRPSQRYLALPPRHCSPNPKYPHREGIRRVHSATDIHRLSSSNPNVALHSCQRCVWRQNSHQIRP